MSQVPQLGMLMPLEYHTTIVAYLQCREPEVWEWGRKRTNHAEQLEELRAALLRETYRIDADAHPTVHATLSQAMDRLGISAPATLYQASAVDMNAMLVYVPGEVHIILHGPILERLAEDELLAVFGHELSHYLLWSRDEGKFLVADRILNDVQASFAVQASHLETYRRYVLHTELFADRGSAIAAGSVGPAISALVKVQTGISKVDPAAYLRQAIEIESSDAKASAAQSHPETFIRARALALWWDETPDLETWLATRLHGPLAMEQLDLPDQAKLQALTRGFLAYYLTGTSLGSDAVLAQIRALFPDWSDSESAVGPEHFVADKVDDSVRGYLNALMMDLALADPDQQDAALQRAGQVAQALDSFEALLLNLRRDAGFGKREIDRFKRQLTKEVRA
ncbi:M48 family metalloprotease [Viridibacterium curvum]|uniref:M48 family metalloprotease n=1 Tax=Viridibacterium curvum TaxID=1101404 RepID=A0ABP9QH90_9RHOO